MMSKIKSGKITYAKILLGVLLAGSLTASFAFEPKNMKSLPQTPKPQAKTIIIDGKPVQLSGDAAGIEKLLRAISESDNFDLKQNKASGEVTLVTKMNVVNEIVAVGYGLKTAPPQNEDEVFVVVDQMPEYPGGIDALRMFLAQNIKYPVKAQEKGTQGKVFVNFVVEKDGTVGMVKIARGTSPDLDAEAVRVVKLMTNWTPGKNSGKPVRVSYTLPINFALQ